jgi:membrane fusion protein, copper/silver efflux system
MKMHPNFKIFLLVSILFFLAGYGVNYFVSGKKPPPERKILYYVDPMNPAYRSDKPGISPACGMPLEPVYAGRDGAAGLERSILQSMPPGTIRITPEKQQMIGVKTITVEKVPWHHTQRVLGRVLPDETRIYRVNAAIGGLIQGISPVTTGSLVKKNDLLATYYSPEYRPTMIAYFNLLKSSNPSSPPEQAGSPTTPRGIANVKELRKREIETKRLTGRGDVTSSIESYKKILFNYGMTAYQMEEMERTDTIPDNIDIRAPASGFVLARNVSTGLYFDRGAEFFRIADLSRVWIQADIFENEATLFKPGMKVKAELPYRKKYFYAKISEVLPQFDPATRTLKIRLTADNPGYDLRPDMFVNLEFSIDGPPAIIVSADAVLDSGLKKTVFVDRGNGFFEPRPVETGRSLGERIEITRGIMPGEKIVMAGNFLLDSESRLQLAATGITGKISRDPVCGMNVNEDRAKAEGNTVEYQGRTYFFCSIESRDTFRKEPERYSKSSPLERNIAIPASNSRGAMKKDKAPKTQAKSESRLSEERPKSNEGMVMPKSSAPGATYNPNNPSDIHGMPPKEKSGSLTGMPAIQKNMGPPPAIMTTPLPPNSGGALPHGIPSFPKPGQGSMPLPENSSQSPKGRTSPLGTSPQANTDELVPPMPISPSESKPGEVSQSIPGVITPPKGRRTFRMSAPPDSRPGGMPPPLPVPPPESKNGGMPAQ